MAIMWSQKANVRHMYEHFRILIESRDTIDYDTRQRNVPMETSRAFALSTLKHLQSEILPTDAAGKLTPSTIPLDHKLVLHATISSQHTPGEGVSGSSKDTVGDRVLPSANPGISSSDANSGTSGKSAHDIRTDGDTSISHRVASVIKETRHQQQDDPDDRKQRQAFKQSKPTHASFHTSLGRELWYCCMHAIHHFALIRVICGEQDINVGRTFGVAPGTLSKMSGGGGSDKDFGLAAVPPGEKQGQVRNPQDAEQTRSNDIGKGKLPQVDDREEKGSQYPRKKDFHREKPNQHHLNPAIGGQGGSGGDAAEGGDKGDVRRSVKGVGGAKL